MPDDIAGAMIDEVSDGLCLKAQDEIIPLQPHEAVAMLTQRRLSQKI